MKESVWFVGLQQITEKIDRIKRQSIASDQELVTLRLQMNAFVRMLKWLFPFNLIFSSFVKKELDAYTKQLEKRKKDIEKIKDEMEHPKPKVLDPKLRIGRNHVCHCGSGKKFKKCCLDKKDDIQVPNSKEINAALKK